MAILVLISRDAHQNGLEAKPTLRGKPKASATGVCFLGYFFCTSKRSNSLSESEIKLSKPGSNSVNSTRYMHCHAVTENRSQRFQYFHHPWRLHGNENDQDKTECVITLITVGYAALTHPTTATESVATSNAHCIKHNTINPYSASPVPPH